MLDAIYTGTHTTMSKLILKLRNVPEDETAEILTLLDQHQVLYTVTEASSWGISPAAIWLTDETDAPRVRKLLDDYGQERAQRSRTAWLQAVARGEAETWIDRFKRRPFVLSLYWLGIAAMIALMLLPFFWLSA